MRIFLLTKTPNSERTKICLCLAASSVDAIVYLAGDGVYNLLGQAEAASQSAAREMTVRLSHPLFPGIES